MISIEVKGLDKLQSVLGEASGRLEKEIDNAMKKSILFIEREAKIRTPVQTGRLRSSFRTEFAPLRALLYPAVHYAKYVHEGTKPHIIFPVAKKALFWRGAKHPVKMVQHPGSRAVKFLENAVQSSVARIKSFFEEAVKKVL